ncbi:ketol-acid reductoisomerase [archaeon D22]|nr:ketol-acid reductoisomerase [archaeon D22]
MVKLLHEEDANLEVLNGKTIAVIGYGAQGRAQSLCLKDSGVDVIVGVRENGPSWEKAKAEGHNVMTVEDAAKAGDIIHILIPDEVQKDVYESQIKEHVTEGKVLSWSHGFNVIFERIAPPEGVDIIMVAPKAPGTEVRRTFEQGFGVPGLYSVYKDVSGSAKDVALAMAKGMGLTRAGVMSCTFGEETYEDLFGEQTVLCGGAVELVKKGFEVLTEAGYPAEMAYFECLHELKLIVDLMYEGGITKMYDVVSNTAEYGGRTVGPKIITEQSKKAMKEALDRVESGQFAKEWIAEHEAGLPNLKRMREEEEKHPIEVVGKQIRALFEKKE